MPDTGSLPASTALAGNFCIGYQFERLQHMSNEKCATCRKPCLTINPRSTLNSSQSMKTGLHSSTFPLNLLDLRVVRYFFVGGVAAVVDLSLFYVFAKLLGFHYLLVGAGAFTVAALVNYSLTIRHVFASGIRFGKQKEFLCVYLVSFIGLLFNQLILFIAVGLLSMEIMVAKCIAIGLVFSWNYLARKHFVFKEMCVR
jgi:putative flippase GtrA